MPVSPSGAARDVCANSGEDALDKLAGGVEPTLIAILSDINMPGMDGLDLLGEVKRRYPELPVMMVTAYAAGGPKPRPPIWLGGFTPAALRRAVRFGDGFTVPGANRDVYDRYVAELKKENRPTDQIRFASGFWCLIVSADPDKTFVEAADHIIYQANNYSEWLSAAGLQPLSAPLKDREDLRRSGLLQVVDPDTAISMIRNFADNVPITHFYSWTVPPGLPPRWAQTHLELFASKVIPAFR